MMNCAKCGISVDEQPLMRVNPKGVKGIWWCEPCVEKYEPELYKNEMAEQTVEKDLKEIFYPSATEMTNLNSIAKSYLLDKGYPMHYFLVALKQACECTEDLAKHTIDIIKTVVLDVDKDGYACLPHDYSAYVRVGGGDNGVPVSFTEGVIYDGTYYLSDTHTVNYVLFPGWYEAWYGWYSEGFVTGPIRYPQYRFQITNKHIRVLAAFAGSQIILDYTPTFGKCNRTTLVPDEAKETIKDWIHWKIPRYERGRQLAANAEDERIYKHSLYKLRAFNNKLTPERLEQIRRESIWRGYK